MKFNPALLSEAVRQVVLALVLFGVLQVTEVQLAGALAALSALLALFTITGTTSNSTLEAAGTSKTQVVEAAKQNAAAGTPGGTGTPGAPGGAGGTDAPRGLGNFSDKASRGLMLLLCLTMAACAARTPAQLIGQAGVISVDSIDKIHEAVITLNLPRDKELPVQRALFDANEKLAALPGLIIAIDNATKAGQKATNEIDQALAYLTEGARYIDSVKGNLSAVPTAAAIVKLVVELQLAITRAQQVVEQVKQPIPKAERPTICDDPRLPVSMHALMCTASAN